MFELLPVVFLFDGYSQVPSGYPVLFLDFLPPLLLGLEYKWKWRFADACHNISPASESVSNLSLFITLLILDLPSAWLFFLSSFIHYFLFCAEVCTNSMHLLFVNMVRFWVLRVFGGKMFCIYHEIFYDAQFPWIWSLGEGAGLEIKFSFTYFQLP